MHVLVEVLTLVHLVRHENRVVVHAEHWVLFLVCLYLMVDVSGAARF